MSQCRYQNVGRSCSTLTKQPPQRCVALLESTGAWFNLNLRSIIETGRPANLLITQLDPRYSVEQHNEQITLVLAHPPQLVVGLSRHDMSAQAIRKPLKQTPAPIIIDQLIDPHEATVIFLHGRGFNAENSHAQLLATSAGDHANLRAALPHTRFVFPTAPLSRATKYRRTLMHQWYDGTGDWEPEALGDMHPSVELIHGLIRSEAELLGNTRHIVLAGFSQGCSMALTSLILWDGDALGAAVGLCGFLPMASHLLGIANDPEQDDGIEFEGGDSNQHMTPLEKVARELGEEAQVSISPRASLVSTPVLLGHGTADDEVDLSQSIKSSTLLKTLSFDVEFCRYTDLGHCYSSDMLGDMASFIRKRVSP